MTTAAGAGATNLGPLVGGLDREQREAMLALLADMRWPAGPKGEILAMLGLEAAKPILCYHLVRCGWRPDLRRRKIKARRPYGKGTVEDAVLWVPVAFPDDPLANVHNMTVAEINRLEPEDVRLEARRRVGLAVPEYEPPAGWHTQTRVNIADEPEPEEAP